MKVGRGSGLPEPSDARGGQLVRIHEWNVTSRAPVIGVVRRIGRARRSGSQNVHQKLFG